VATRREGNSVGTHTGTLEPDWWRALATGDYLRSIALLRATVDDREPISYDSLAYLLQAVGRFADADALRRRRAELERPRGLEALPEELRLALAHASHAPPASCPEMSPADAAAVLAEAVASRRVIILGEEQGCATSAAKTL
jgi:hypothetical protein